MLNRFNRNAARKFRHNRIRNKISGTPEKPRLTVYKSNKNVYAQIIDDTTGRTLVSASTLEADLKSGKSAGKEEAKSVGELVGKRALEEGIEEVVFDRSGYRYHGKVKELADGAREAGLKL